MPIAQHDGVIQKKILDGVHKKVYTFFYKLMNTIKTMTLDELRKTPLTDEEKAIIRSVSEKAKAGKTVEDPDCPKQTKEELAQFKPWYEVHPDFYKVKKAEIHIRIDADVLEWYKAQGKGYQTKMNEVLRAYAFKS